MTQKPTPEALRLASDLRDVADRLEIMAKHLSGPNSHGPSADTLGDLALRLVGHCVDWEVSKLYSKVK